MNIFEKLLYLPDYLIGFGMSDPNRNGEYRFLRSYMKDNMIVIDVGANIGSYTEYLLKYREQLEVHAFEPVKETFMEMKRRLNKKQYSSKIFINNFGMSDRIEESEIIIYGSLAGSNSLFHNQEIAARSNPISKEIIQLSTIDSYIEKNNIRVVHLMKIDVEGYEPNVLLGAQTSFNKKIIKAVQFEYGGFWRSSAHNLSEMIEFLNTYSFKIYRLTPWGKLKINISSKKIENFKHSNYLALSQN